MIITVDDESGNISTVRADAIAWPDAVELIIRALQGAGYHVPVFAEKVIDAMDMVFDDSGIDPIDKQV